MPPILECHSGKLRQGTIPFIHEILKILSYFLDRIHGILRMDGMDFARRQAFPFIPQTMPTMKDTKSMKA